MSEPCPICAEFRYISIVKVCPICGSPQTARGEGNRRRVSEEMGVPNVRGGLGPDHSTPSGHGPAFLSSMLAARSRSGVQIVPATGT